MNSLRRLVAVIRVRLGVYQGFASGVDQDDKNGLKLTNEQVERLRKGTIALFTCSIHP
jgi:hypothetical protein